LNRKMHPKQIQDFIPLPLTLSGCMYYTGEHPFTGEKIYVARTFRERKMHRALMQYRSPKNKTLIKEALKILHKEVLFKRYLTGSAGLKKHNMVD